MKLLHTQAGIGAAFLMLLAGATSAADLKLVTVAEKENVTLNANGEKRIDMVPVTTVVPGDEVIYTITFTNEGVEAAERVVITDPVPAEMRYVDGSAFGPGADIEFSIDSGETWGSPDALFVTADDGSRRRAGAGDYTHIRWSMRAPLAAGGRGYARFRAQLR